MHVMGNILDLIFVEQVGNIKISIVKEDPMFSDHKSVECEIEKSACNQILCRAKP